MKKILVVDDDSNILNVMEIILLHHFFNVRTTAKWPVFSKTVKSFEPDLILLDIDLEGADGGELCKEFKRSKNTKQVPVILFSVHNMPDSYVKECNAQGFLYKPFKEVELVKIIKDNLN